MPDDDPFIWHPTLEHIGRSRLRGFMDKLAVDDLQQLAQRARDDLDGFWRAAVDDIGVDWTVAPQTIHDSGDGLPWTRWWLGGRLNLAINACDRWADRTPDRIALISEGDEGARSVTYAELAADVAGAASLLRSLGVGPGDVVGLCLPFIPECVTVFLASAKVGAIVAPLFSGFGASAISTRLSNCGAKVLFIADGFIRRGSPVLMKETADAAAQDIPTLQHIVVVRRLGDPSVRMEPGRDRWFDEALSEAQPNAATEDTAASDPFMLIYTSGTTGFPKGTVHTHGGFPIKAMQDMAHCFDVVTEDRLLWYTDIGWMMGPWAICGALGLGATLVMFDGVPDHPRPDRLWSVVERHNVSVLGVAPTVIRALMRHGDAPPRAHDLSSLRVLGSSGEPWNVDPWMWFYKVVGGERCPIINYSGGTEVSGGILSGNVLTPMKPCAFSGPCPGMDADVYDEQGRSIRGAVGELVVRSPWPGMTAGLWRDPERYLATYWSRWPDVWVHGDWAEVDEDGAWFIRGRSDDTLKVAGKRIGPAEVESALVAHPAVAEAAVIGIPDDVKGEVMVAFVVIADAYGSEPPPMGELTDCVGDALGRALRPERVIPIAELPKTRNAKVLRRVLRAIYLDLDPGDLASLDNPSAIDAIRAAREVR